MDVNSSQCCIKYAEICAVETSKSKSNNDLTSGSSSDDDIRDVSDSISHTSWSTQTQLESIYAERAYVLVFSWRQENNLVSKKIWHTNSTIICHGSAVRQYRERKRENERYGLSTSYKY